MSAKEQVCIIVVLYNPNFDHIKNIEELATQFTVVAVDNSCEQVAIKKAYYIPLYENRGIAVAQNIGIRYAKEQGYNYILLLDQDSRVDADFVNIMFETFLSIKKIDNRVGFIGPVFVDYQTGKEYKNYIDRSCLFTQVDAIIASGSLISMNALNKVGGMEEKLFIDLVDFEWCWRAYSFGFTGYMIREAKMYHSLGKEYYNWRGFVLGVSTPFRYFYQYRNNLWLCRRKYVPFKWKVKSILRGVIDMFLVPIVSHQGKDCFVYMLKGIKAGLVITA